MLSRDAVTGEQTTKPVTEVFVNQATELVHIDLGAETITATPGHPFWVEGIGWVDAEELAAGDEVSLADGERATILSVVREHLQSPVDVYNFEVADYHTYFVASAGVWVHNACTQSVKGATRGQHRYHANKQVYQVLQKGGKAAKKLRKKYGDDAIDEFIANKGKRNIRGTQWHHNRQDTLNPLRRRATMTLKTKAEHRAWHGANGRASGFKQGVDAKWYH